MPRIHLYFLVCCLIALAVPRFFAQQAEEPPKPSGNLHIYLLIGQSNMAGRAEIPEDAAGIIDRCFLLNDKNEWEPASNPLNRHSAIRKGLGMQKLGPGYSSDPYTQIQTGTPMPRRWLVGGEWIDDC